MPRTTNLTNKPPKRNKPTAKVVGTGGSDIESIPLFRYEWSRYPNAGNTQTNCKALGYGPI